MKKILVISGSRADAGLLEWPVKVLSEAFEVSFISINAKDSADAFTKANVLLGETKPDCLLILGDRWEILQAAIAAHLQRVPIAHIAGGDKTLGSYDDAMRDCISRLASYHFPTSPESAATLQMMGRYCMNQDWQVHMVGNVAMDYILNGDWKRGRIYADPYVVISYQPETIDGADNIDSCLNAIEGRNAVLLLPNSDLGSEAISHKLHDYAARLGVILAVNMSRQDYLNLIFHCDELIGNSSSMLYEAPALGVKCRMIGRRQEGRVAPTGDGRASERIKEILCRVL